MKKHILAIVLAAAAAAVTSACVGFEHTSTQTGPTALGVNALMGTWVSSSASLVPSPSECGNFHWNVTEQTATSARGTFSATCAGDLAVSGSAQGTLSSSTITWSGTGTATAPGLSSCAIALNGTAELGTDSIRIPYSGTTCLGAVSGVQVLRKS